jgi:hypothetical protein
VVYSWWQEAARADWVDAMLALINMVQVVLLAYIGSTVTRVNRNNIKHRNGQRSSDVSSEGRDQRDS